MNIIFHYLLFFFTLAIVAQKGKDIMGHVGFDTDITVFRLDSRGLSNQRMFTVNMSEKMRDSRSKPPRNRINFTALSKPSKLLSCFTMKLINMFSINSELF